MGWTEVKQKQQQKKQKRNRTWCWSAVKSRYTGEELLAKQTAAVGDGFPLRLRGLNYDNKNDSQQDPGSTTSA